MRYKTDMIISSSVCFPLPSIDSCKYLVIRCRLYCYFILIDEIIREAKRFVLNATLALFSHMCKKISWPVDIPSLCCSRCNLFLAPLICYCSHNTLLDITEVSSSVSLLKKSCFIFHSPKILMQLLSFW